jgi:pyrimidine-nucleoside phosphorylase
MSFVDLIIKKRDGKELTTAEINAFVKGVTDNTLPDYQVSAMLMAICIKSLSARETADLTLAMTHSGDILDLSAVDGIKVDKHSTGGVADTTTLVLAPLTASLGLKVMKMSGRGLGHTGGTLDKLESIPGFNIAMGKEAAVKQVNDIGIAIIGQTADLAPADKRMYALRDVTGTVESIPLIAASIMSKKLAAGTDAIVLDVKYGSGAFMKNSTDARRLAEAMVNIGKSVGKKTVALITPMDRPLGMHIGNSLEVIEAIEILKGHVGGRLKTVSLKLSARMLVLGGIADNLNTALNMLNENISNGKGLEKLKQLIKAQGGNPLVCDDYSLFPSAKESYTLTAWQSGYITSIATDEIGKASVATGAGRVIKDAPIDLSAGIIMKATVGDYVNKGDAICDILAGELEMCKSAADIITSAITISDTQPKELAPVLEVIE